MQDSNTKKIKILYLRPVTKIEKLVKGDWIDLRAGKSISLRKGESAIIPLGIAIQLPKGYEAIIAPRSSTFKHYGIIQTNSIGVVDETYCGDTDEWGLPVVALRDTMIKFDERICQFRIIRHQPDIEFEETDALGNEVRGGFGSTGRA